LGLWLVLAAGRPATLLDLTGRCHPRGWTPTPFAVFSRKALQHHDCLVDMFTLLAQVGEHFKNVHVRRVVERRSVDSRRKPLHERKARLLTASIALGSALLLQNFANLVVAGVDPATISVLLRSLFWQDCGLPQRVIFCFGQIIQLLDLPFFETKGLWVSRQP